jgi:hypothetical protein
MSGKGTHCQFAFKVVDLLRDCLADPGSSSLLRKRLGIFYGPLSSDDDASHKVPKRLGKGKGGGFDRAREILKNCCIGIEAAINGSPVDHDYHIKQVHGTKRKQYERKLAKELGVAEQIGCEAVPRKLLSISKQLG